MNKNRCDILIHNGQLVTMNAARTIYPSGAVAVTNSRIVEVGADAELRPKYDAGETIDAAGAIVHPGFIDAHNHIVHTTCRGVFGNIHDVDASTIKFADWKADVTSDDEAAATAMASLTWVASVTTLFLALLAVACILTPVPTLVLAVGTELVDERVRSSSVGMIYGFNEAASALSPLVGGLVAEAMGLQMAFSFYASMFVIGGFIAIFLHRESALQPQAQRGET